jgi:hypothetical protein
MNDIMNSQSRVGKDMKEGVFDVVIFQIVMVVSMYIQLLSAQDVKLPVLV